MSSSSFLLPPIARGRGKQRARSPRRRNAETPTEYLLRTLTGNDAAVAPGTLLTGLFERARYSQLPVSESMRSEAISALRALQGAYLLRAVN